jgi:energy-converting hydrogenase Eha subunit C
MVNNDRIVPITKIDYLSMIGTAMTLASTSFSVLASDVEGTFTVTGTGAAGNKLANQPAKSINFASGVTSGTVYFVASNDFTGITVAGAAATIDDSGVALADVAKDGVTLYTAALSSGTVTITAVTPSLS